MGSNNSTESNNRASAAPVEQNRRQRQDEFQYGPSSNQQTYQGQPINVGNQPNNVTNRPNNAANQSRVPPQNMSVPPPPYSSVDVAYSARSANVSSNRYPEVPSNVFYGCPPPLATRVEQRHVQETSRLPTVPPRSNVQQSVPQLPQPVSQRPQPVSQRPQPVSQIQQRNPYKWTSTENLQAPVALKVNTKTSSNRSTPNQTPSPEYNSNQNPYVWVNKQAETSMKSPRKVIDLDLELPKIKQAIKGSVNPNFQHFNKELNKNKAISDVRKAMANTMYLTDVKFIVGGKVFTSHKMIVVTSSFLFYEHFHVKNEKEMTIDGIEPEIFEKILSYCYTDKIQVKEADVLELLLAGTKLQVRQITNVCHGFISNMMSPDSVFMIFDKALEIGNEVFQKKCIEFINKNEEKCMASKGFFLVSLPSLVRMLEVCKFPREKISDVVEKWTNGSIGILDEPPKPQDVNMNMKPAGAVKNPQGKKQKNQKPKPLIPDLMSLSIPPPIPSPFSFPPPPCFNNFPPNPPMGQLITVDDEDDCSCIINKDDESSRILVDGLRNQMATEFSRIDFVCKRSMLIHEIGFGENLAHKSKEIRVSIGVFEQNKRSDLHNRVINNGAKSGMKTNFIRFSRDPLKLYIGQKFFIKVNFSESAKRLNIHPEYLSPNDFLEIRKDADVKKYFNCISSLLVSEMPSA